MAGRADEGLSREIKDAVHSLESIQARDLMKLLGRVKAAASAVIEYELTGDKKIGQAPMLRFLERGCFPVDIYAGGG